MILESSKRYENVNILLRGQTNFAKRKQLEQSAVNKSKEKQAYSLYHDG
jgi:hypothetical protein